MNTQQRRAYGNPSFANVKKNLTGFFNTFISPVLGTPKTYIYKDAYKLRQAQLENMRNKVYGEGEMIPNAINNSSFKVYGDGSGRTYKEGGFTPCRNRFDGRIRPGVDELDRCVKFRKKYKQKFVEGEGFKPRFVEMEKDFTGEYKPFPVISP